MGRFMESIMPKTGAMRKLVRELKTQYVDPAAGQFLGLFEKHLDPSHAICNFSSLCQSRFFLRLNFNRVPVSAIRSRSYL